MGKCEFLNKSIIAHRGIYNNITIYENSLDAIMYAVKNNLSVSIDVRCTNDEIIVFSDKDGTRFLKLKDDINTLSKEVLYDTPYGELPTPSRTGYKFKGKNRLNVFLTNSLEKPGNDEYQMSLFYDALSGESIEANKVKKSKYINVCIGNPPYNAASQNSGEWIMDMIKEYKMEPGGMEKLNERNPKWINDDYVKLF